MSSVGYGPGIGSGAIVEIGAVRGAGSPDSGPTRQSATPSRAPAAAAPPVASAALDAGAAPIDQDRVATIKKAIANNSYPLVPTKIGDAMIAAGMLLRMAK